MKERAEERRQLRGPEAIAEALERDGALRFVLCREGPITAECEALLARVEAAGVPVRRIAQRQLMRMQPAGCDDVMLALEGPAPAAKLAEVMQQSGAVWLLADCGYPGNVGYAIRSAEVSGAAGVVISSDFDRVERRDCLRYAMRVDRFFPVHFAAAEQAVALAREAGRSVIALEDSGERAPWEVDLRGPCLLLIGGEAGGVPPGLLERADHVIRVPMHGFLPSYNLQAAMAVVMGERLRQIDSR